MKILCRRFLFIVVVAFVFSLKAPFPRETREKTKKAKGAFFLDKKIKGG